MKLNVEQKEMRKELKDRFLDMDGEIFDYPVFEIVVLVRMPDENWSLAEVVVVRDPSRKLRELTALQRWDASQCIDFPVLEGIGEKEVAEMVLEIVRSAYA